MKTSNTARLRFFRRLLPLAGAAGLIIAAEAPSALAAPKLKPEELIAKHLQSLGGTAAWNEFQRLQATGRSTVIARIGGSGRMDGDAKISSSGQTWQLEMTFDNPNFPHEKLGYDGEKADVATLSPRGRSPFGGFIYSQERPLTEGLMGGVLSTAWPLHNVEERQAKLKYRGMKKIDGKELHLLDYDPKKGTDLRIRLYFEPETFRHVRSEYSMTVSAASVKLSSSSTQLPDTRYEIVEEFSDFRPEGQLTLPHSYRIRYSAHGEKSLAVDYELNFDKFEFQ